MFAFARSRPLRVLQHVGGRRLLSDGALIVPVPEKPKGWPTPWITEEDATNYLFPLYSLGWYIVGNPSRYASRTASLACNLKFLKPSPASAFAREIIELSETENHHPSWLKVSHSTGSSVVEVCSATHSALRPEWDPADTPASRALEGLTVRDLRFAALVSSLSTFPASPSDDIEPGPTRPNWDDLCAKLQLWSAPKQPKGSPKQPEERKDSCIACGGPHTISACAMRHTIEPPPCAVCRGPHWRVDCPVVDLARRKNIGIVKAKAWVGRPAPNPPLPPTPCPNCGGPHWKTDCRQPQAPPELLRRFELPENP
ncbi:hypothetical protein DFH07DRAFT_857529 [Mycena maculata]|uniref:4a-hydroxytetrahydrobiopterin dehydratase n=1 Tax=Mycena maculata TaxID=230809 RepID=A0AAD7HIV5_9AGAR|nr:hypothetical protein DFH07DRAFT_857529 [Mycena maculata]